MRLKSITLAAMVVAASACAITPGPGDPGYPFNVSGSYTGRLRVDGQPFDATLQLRTTPGGSVRGALRVSVPVEIEGRVEGVIIDDLLRLTISYRDARDCESGIQGILTVERGGAVIEGPVTVDDCGTATAGRMNFRRQSRGPRGR